LNGDRLHSFASFVHGSELTIIFRTDVSCCPMPFVLTTENAEWSHRQCDDRWWRLFFRSILDTWHRNSFGSVLRYQGSRRNNLPTRILLSDFARIDRWTYDSIGFTSEQLRRISVSCSCLLLLRTERLGTSPDNFLDDIRRMVCPYRQNCR
jgi:hypothetical protein